MKAVGIRELGSTTVREYTCSPGIYFCAILKLPRLLATNNEKRHVMEFFTSEKNRLLRRQVCIGNTVLTGSASEVAN